MSNLCDSNRTIPWAAQDALYAELAKVSNVAALSPQERAAYEETLKQYRDNIACYEAAIEDGMRTFILINVFAISVYPILPMIIRRFIVGIRRVPWSNAPTGRYRTRRPVGASTSAICDTRALLASIVKCKPFVILYTGMIEKQFVFLNK